jgi:hypothetical protein
MIAMDEIKEPIECRCICICEQDALWMLLGFEIHYHWPQVERLPIHLPLILSDIAKDPKNSKTNIC